MRRVRKGARSCGALEEPQEVVKSALDRDLPALLGSHGNDAGQAPFGALRLWFLAPDLTRGDICHRPAKLAVIGWSVFHNGRFDSPA